MLARLLCVALPRTSVSGQIALESTERRGLARVGQFITVTGDRLVGDVPRPEGRSWASREKTRISFRSPDDGQSRRMLLDDVEVFPIDP